MTGRSAAIGFLSAIALVGAACTSSLSGNTTGPSSSPTEASPSSSASSTPSSSPSSSPASSPSSTATPGAPLAITNLPFHNGEVGVIYLAVTLGASGGAPPYTWSVGSGTFPPGLHLSNDGVVTGNNTAAGTFNFTVHVADSAGGTADAAKSLRVFTALAVTAPCATVCAVEEGCTICGNFGAVSGGLPPYHLSIVSDNRPKGMGITGLDLTGAFPGPGNYSVTIQVQDDQFGATRTVSANWSVFAHIAFTGPSTWLCGNSPSSCSLNIPYTGGKPGGSPTIQVVSVGPLTGVFTGPPPAASMSVPQPTCQTPTAVTPTTLPPGTTSSASGGTLTVNIGPPDLPPTNYPFCGYQASVTIELVDPSPCGPGNCISTNFVTINISV